MRNKDERKRFKCQEERNFIKKVATEKPIYNNLAELKRHLTD